MRDSVIVMGEEEATLGAQIALGDRRYGIYVGPGAYLSADPAATSLSVPADIDGTPLVGLCAPDGSLSSVDLSTASNLRALDVTLNYLDSLDLSGCSCLEFLSCAGNSMTSLYFDELPNLRFVDMSSNGATSLNIGNCDSLRIIVADDNPLGSLLLADLPSLERASVAGCSLISLELGNLPSLQRLDAPCNFIDNLDLSSCDALSCLDVSFNEALSIGSLDIERLDAFQAMGTPLAYASLSDSVRLGANEGGR